jgi:predicted PurR-regulated permease PerM
MGDDRFYARLFAVGLLAVVGIALFALMRPFAASIAWALLLAFLLQPVNVRARHRLHDRRGLAALVITLEDPLHLPSSGDFSDWLDTHFSVSLESIFADLGKNMAKVSSVVVAQGENVLRGVLGTGAGMLLMFFILFFALRRGDEAANRFIELLPLREDHKKTLVTEMSSVTRATVLGAGVTALTQGFLVGVAFAITRMPSPVVFGVIASLASILPIGGTALVWGPAAIALAVQGRWGASLFVVLWGVLVVAMADIVHPAALRRRSCSRVHARRVSRRARWDSALRAARRFPRTDHRRARADPAAFCARGKGGRATEVSLTAPVLVLREARTRD